MNSVPCPGCGLPRQADSIGRVPCPVCADGARAHSPGVANPPPARDARDPTRGLPADASELARAPAAPHPRRPSSPVPLLFVAGIAAGALALWGWQSLGDVASGGRQPPVESQAPSQVASQLDSQVATKPTGVSPPPPAKPQPPEVAPMPRAYVAVAPMPHAPLRPPPARVTQVDHPNAEYTPQVPPGATVTLKGRAKVLRVPPLERGATLDTTQLEVGDVYVGKIDGGSKLRVGSVNGRVTFQGKVDGGSTVEVSAPTGTVTFAVPTSPGKDGSRIAGGSEVRITARFTTFVGQISGRGTLVAVTVTRGGAVGFAEMDGPCRLEYRKADRGDPDPSVTKGKVSAASKLARVD